jgi:hypothetical protein
MLENRRRTRGKPLTAGMRKSVALPPRVQSLRGTRRLNGGRAERKPLTIPTGHLPFPPLFCGNSLHRFHSRLSSTAAPKSQHLPSTTFHAANTPDENGRYKLTTKTLEKSCSSWNFLNTAINSNQYKYRLSTLTDNKSAILLIATRPKEQRLEA